MNNKNFTKGVVLSLVSLLLLGIMPIISNSRPMEIDALSFALYLSIWQLIFSVPVLFLDGAVSAAIAIQAYPLFAILWESIFLNRKKSIGELFFTILLIAGLLERGTCLVS